MNKKSNNLDSLVKLSESLPNNDLEDLLENHKYNKGDIYMHEIAEQHSKNIQMNINRMSGMPCVKNTRISVSLIVSCLKDGLSIEDIMENYKLNKEQIKGALDYVQDLLDRPYM